MKRFTTADLIDPEHHPQFTGVLLQCLFDRFGSVFP